MNKKLIAIIMMCSMFGMSGCNYSSQTGENSVPKKEWIDIRGTDVVLQNKDGVRLCVSLPNGVSATDHKESLTIEFEDFDGFSISSVKRPIDYKVGVSSIYIYPTSSNDLSSLRARQLSFGNKLVLSMNGFEVFQSKFDDEEVMLSIINTEKKIYIRFAAGKNIRNKYDKETFLIKLITEISAITHNCT